MPRGSELRRSVTEAPGRPAAGGSQAWRSLSTVGRPGGAGSEEDGPAEGEWRSMPEAGRHSSNVHRSVDSALLGAGAGAAAAAAAARPDVGRSVDGLPLPTAGGGGGMQAPFAAAAAPMGSPSPYSLPSVPSPSPGYYSEKSPPSGGGLFGRKGGAACR